MKANFVDDVGIADGCIHRRPENRMPPLVRLDACLIVGPQLIGNVDTVHVVVVVVNNIETLFSGSYRFPRASRCIEAWVLACKVNILQLPVASGQHVHRFIIKDAEGHNISPCCPLHGTIVRESFYDSLAIMTVKPTEFSYVDLQQGVVRYFTTS